MRAGNKGETYPGIEPTTTAIASTWLFSLTVFVASLGLISGATHTRECRLFVMNHCQPDDAHVVDLGIPDTFREAGIQNVSVNIISTCSINHFEQHFLYDFFYPASSKMTKSQVRLEHEKLNSFL